MINRLKMMLGIFLFSTPPKLVLAFVAFMSFIVVATIVDIHDEKEPKEVKVINIEKCVVTESGNKTTYVCEGEENE